MTHVIKFDNNPLEWYKNVPRSETGWDLGPFTAVLAPGQMPAPAIEYKETRKD